ncbi:conserved domain protein [Streptococcus sp. oral taxon 056 str. F0418]|nr:conserved domain protein [Streptococcus sp. oral taxon 056 str. F0418]
MTVKVETAKVSVMVVMGALSISFLAIDVIWRFFLTKEISEKAIFPQPLQRKRCF